MSTDALLNEVKKLDPTQRVQLIDDIWQTLYEEDAAITLTPEQLRILDERLDRIEREGPSGTSWEDLKARIQAERQR